jgi:hypothetical protein
MTKIFRSTTRNWVCQLLFLSLYLIHQLFFFCSFTPTCLFNCFFCRVYIRFWCMHLVIPIHQLFFFRSFTPTCLFNCFFCWVYIWFWCTRLVICVARQQQLPTLKPFKNARNITDWDNLKQKNAVLDVAESVLHLSSFHGINVSLI